MFRSIWRSLSIIVVLAYPTPPAFGSTIQTAKLQPVHTLLENLASSPSDPASPSWLNSNWRYRIKITARPDSIQGLAAFVGFPVLLPLNASNLAQVFAHAKTDGSDIIITKRDGLTPLPREIVTYDQPNRLAELWFKADSLSRNTNVFYIYYGNPDTTIALHDGTTWDNRYLAVYHFAENPAGRVLRDYGPHGNDAQPQNGWTAGNATFGQIGRGWKFNGVTNWIDGDAISSGDSTFTVSAWLAVWDQANAPSNFALQVEQGYWNIAAMRTSLDRSPDLGTEQGEMSWMPAGLPDTLLHNFLWSMDGVSDTARFFFDGREQSVATDYAPNPPYKVYTGEHFAGNVGVMSPVWGGTLDLFHGVADEYRVYNGVHTPDWIRTEYRNQKSGTRFFQYDQEQAVAASPLVSASGSGSLLLFPNPFQSQAIYQLRLARPENGQIEILDVSGRLVRRMYFQSPPSGVVQGSLNGRNLPSGTYFVRAKTPSAIVKGTITLLR